MKKRRIRDYSTDYTYGYTTGYLGMWLMPTKGGERTSPEDEGEDAVGRLHRGLQRCGEAIERRASTGVDQHGEERAGFED